MSDFGGRVRTLGSVPAALSNPLREHLASTEREDPLFWSTQDHAKPNRFDVFEDTTEHVVFGFPETTRSHLRSRRFATWALWEPLIAPIIEHVVQPYGYAAGRCNRIMLARLRPGRTIAMHIDGDDSSRVPHKIHVPLVTNARVLFWEHDEAFHLAVGYAYEVNNRIPHGVQNLGTTARVHLVFDYFDGEQAS